MNKTQKIILYTFIGLVVAGAVLGVVGGSKSKKKREAEKAALLKKLEDLNNLSKKEKAELEAQSLEAIQEAVQDINTDIGNVRVGKIAYPKGESTNIRSQAYVNNGWINNIIEEDAEGKLGNVLKVVNSTEYGDKNMWYQIQLANPIIGGMTKGYVREDVITLKNS